MDGSIYKNQGITGNLDKVENMSLAWRNLLQNKTRLALSISGVALSVTLILLLNGFLDGLYKQITSYLDYSPGTLVVAQEDVVNLLGATLLMRDGVISQIEDVNGVDEVIPILSQFVILDLHGKKQPTYMIGYDLDKGGGPWKMFAGREPRTKSEMVFDRVLADRHHLQIGDEIKVLGKNFTIVGLSSGTTSWMTSFFFVRKEAAEDLFLAPEVTSFLFLTTTPGREPANILQELNKIKDVTALTKKEVAANDLKLFAKVFSAPLKLMVGIAFLVGGMIVGLVIYTITVERQREYGVFKAIGAPNRVLYQVVLTQAMFATTAGTILGVMLAFGFSRLIMTVKQQFLIVIDPSDVGVAFLAGLGMALIAALFPARVVADLAPAEVFRK